MGGDNSYVFVFSEFSDLCNFAFSTLLRTSLSKEPLETLDSLTTADFLVSVRISNLLFIVGYLSVFVVKGILLGSAKVFGSRFPRFCHWRDVKPQGRISFIF